MAASIAPHRHVRRCAIIAARLALVAAVVAACGEPAIKWPAAKPRAGGGFHDPDHARGALPSEASRRTELGIVRRDLDTMYAHRKAKLARYSLDEDALFAEAEARLYAATTWAAYDAAIYDLLARFHDGHLTYRPPQTAAPSKGYDSYRLGFRTVFARGVYLVTTVEPGSDAAVAGMQPGDEIVQIDDRTMAKVLDVADDARSTSRPESAWTALAKTWTAVLVPKGDKPRNRSVIVRHRDGREQTIAIVPKLAPKEKREAVTVTKDGDVAIVTIKSLDGNKRAAQIDDALKQARTAKAIVIDLRGNRGGTDKVGHRIVAGLAEGSALIATYRVLVAPETIGRRPQWKALEGTGDADGFSPVQTTTVAALDHRYPGKVAVIVDAACVSSCEVVTAALRADVGAKIIGAITGGSSGAPVSVTLPSSKGSVQIPTWNLLSAEGRTIEDDGVAPDLEVYATPDSLAAGDDLPLHQALDLVRM